MLMTLRDVNFVDDQNLQFYRFFRNLLYFRSKKFMVSCQNIFVIAKTDCSIRVF